MFLVQLLLHQSTILEKLTNKFISERWPPRRSPEEREEWIKAIQKAVDDLEVKRKTFAKRTSQSGTDFEEQMDSPGEVRLAPVWTPDKRVTMCQLCQAAFTVIRRRHHCRACGKSQRLEPLASESSKYVQWMYPLLGGFFH